MKHGHCIWILLLMVCLTTIADDQNELQMAADKGDVICQLKLAHQLISLKRYEAAIKYLEKAQDKGSVQAPRALGVIYANPEFKSFDQKKAFGFFVRAADRGDAMCQFLVATYFDRGDIISKSPKDVIKWLRLSANGGYGPAQLRLAELYETGVLDVLSKNSVEAYIYYRKALDTATAEVGTFIDPKELLDRIVRLKSSLSTSDLNLVTSKGKGLFTDPLPIWIQSHSLRSLSQGSGFIITKDGYLVTNHHVVGSGSCFLVKTTFGVAEATVKDIDSDNDLAILKMEGDYLPAPIVNSENSASVGEKIFVYGYPAASTFGQEEPKYVEGNISSTDFVRGSEVKDYTRNLGITASITHGNSGGAVFDMRGNVVGVAVSGWSENIQDDIYKVQQAIKSARLLQFLDKHPNVRNSLATPILWDRASEEVVAEARQAVVLIMAYYSAFDFVSEYVPNYRIIAHELLFEKRTGKKCSEVTEDEFKTFTKGLDPKEVANVMIVLLKNKALKLNWNESQINEALDRLQKEGKL